MLLVGTARAPRAAGPQRAVALRAAAVHRLPQDPVDLLAQLDDVGCGDSTLAALRHGEHVLVQRAPGDGQRGRKRASEHQGAEKSDTVPRPEQRFHLYYTLHVCGCQRHISLL